jgi:hypothetical protein
VAGSLQGSAFAKAVVANAIMPVTVYAKSVTVLTTGVPADVATIPVPAGITRWKLIGTSGSSANAMIVETQTATTAAASFTCFDAAAGGGNAVTTASVPAAVANGVTVMPSSLSNASTSANITVRQTIASVNAGTISFYLTLLPMP